MLLYYLCLMYFGTLPFKMKKIHAWLLILIIAPLTAGLYGMIHDQLTYTLSPEFYTKFKFHQFGLIEEGMNADIQNPRIKVAIVGFSATWWIGLLIGFVLATIGLMHDNVKVMLKTSLLAFTIIIAITMSTGVMGWFYGHYVASHERPESYPHWFIPEHLKDYESFVTVGWIHNSGYMGAVVGLLIAVVFSIITHRKNRSKTDLS